MELQSTSHHSAQPVEAAPAPCGSGLDKIILRRDAAADCWLAEHSGPRAAEVVDLFGTATLPTPFRCSYPAEWVANELRELNPGVIVEVA